MKEILTGNYENCMFGNLISISYDEGKKAKFKGKFMPSLSPNEKIYRNWKENRDVDEFILNYYNKTLKKLDPELIYNSLDNSSIFISYEDTLERHLVAFWFELFLGITTYEIRVNPKRETKIVIERPEYLKEKLEKVIKENYKMHDYKSIRAAYLYNKARKLEKILLDSSTYKECNEIYTLKNMAKDEEYAYKLSIN